MRRRRSRGYAPARRAKKPALRRQYVRLRNRQRTEFSRQTRIILIRGAVALGMAALGTLVYWHSHDWIHRQLQRHTPELSLKAPAGLSGLPIFSVLPKRRWTLWLPGVPTLAEHRIEQKFPGVWHAHIANHFFENRIDIQLGPRKPLVQCKGQFMDGEGVLFSLEQTSNVVPPNAVPLNAVLSKTLPQMVVPSGQQVRNVGPWLSALSRVSWLWDDLTELKENSQGDWTLVLRSGSVLVWGASDENVPAKTEILQKIRTRAAADHGGALRTDLRFFREGRIIVTVRRPLHA